MSDKEKSFLSLLEKVTDSYSLDVPNSFGTTYKFKALTTEQLKNIVQTVVDTSTAQINFHEAIFNSMKENYIGDIQVTFNVLDKLFYIIDNRIQAVNSTLFIRGDGDSYIPIDLTEVKQKLIDLVKTNSNMATNTALELTNVLVQVGIPTVEAERQANTEVYASLNLQKTDTEDVQDTLGQVFLTEIVKWIKSITIEEGDKKEEINFEKLSSFTKVQILEKLPASVTEKVIDYIEKTKQTIDKCLIVSNRILPLNGSLFSVR